jgi:putative MATE family efflux protein
MANSNESTEARAALMGTDRIGKLLVQFAVPAILMNLVSSAYNMVDKIFVGRMVGDLGITATTVANPVMRIITAFAILIGAGGNALLALRLGEGKHKEAEGILNNSFLLITIITLTLSALGLIFIHPLLSILGCSADAQPLALIYVRIVLIGGFFEAVTSGMGMFIRTDGKPKFMMACTISGCIINIVLDPIMIGVFRWGIAGAAIATVFAQVISGCLILYYFTLSKKSTIKLRLREFRLRSDVTKTTCQLGTSSFISQLTGAITQTIMLASLGLYASTALEGDLYIASIGVTLSIGLLFMMPIVGMQQAVQPILGYNYGAKKYDRVLHTFKWAMISVTIMALIGWAVMMLWAEGLSSIFGADPEYLSIYARSMRIYNVTLPLVPISMLGSNLFQAIGKPRPAIMLSLTRQIFALLPAVLILPLIFGVDGVVGAMPVADIVSGIVGTIMVARELRGIARLRDADQLPVHP